MFSSGFCTVLSVPGPHGIRFLCQKFNKKFFPSHLSFQNWLKLFSLSLSLNVEHCSKLFSFLLQLHHGFIFLSLLPTLYSHIPSTDLFFPQYACQTVVQISTHWFSMYMSIWWRFLCLRFGNSGMSSSVSLCSLQGVELKLWALLCNRSWPLSTVSSSTTGSPFGWVCSWLSNWTCEIIKFFFFYNSSNSKFGFS